MRWTSASALAASNRCGPLLDLDRELVAFERAVALEGDAVDDLAGLGDGDDHLAADDLGADLAEHAGRREVGDGAVDARLIGAGEIGANGRRVGVARALDDHVLRRDLSQSRGGLAMPPHKRTPPRIGARSNTYEKNAFGSSSPFPDPGLTTPAFSAAPFSGAAARPRCRALLRGRRARPLQQTVLNPLLPVLTGGANPNSPPPDQFAGPWPEGHDSWSING